MKRKVFTSLLCGMAALGIVLSGCSSAQKGAAAGGIVGAAAGGIWGGVAPTSLAVAETTLIGTVGGVATGAVVGDQFDQKDARDTDRELENLQAQLINREEALAALQASGQDGYAGNFNADSEEIQLQISDLNQRIEALSQQNTDLNEQVAVVSSANQELTEQLSEIESVKHQALTDRDRAMNELSNLRNQKTTLDNRIEKLHNEINGLQGKLTNKNNRLVSLESVLAEKDSAVDSLRQELDALNVKLEETNQGLTLTILDQLLYSSGQAELTSSGQGLIEQVANIIHEQFPGRELIVEGHTDNRPIKFSQWPSNWELSSARALAVVHEFVSTHGFPPEKVSAMSFGEYRPAATNDTPEGRRINRRSVIVILPAKMPLQKQVATIAE